MKPLAYETRHARGGVLPTHRHHRPYAALVIDGSYTECSLDGPLICERGTIVVHPPFHAHGDRFGCHGARVINVDLPATLAAIEATAWRAHDLDEAREVFEHCPQRLPQLLECARPAPPSELSAWQHDLLTLLREGEDEVSALAKHVGVSAEHASRAFRRSHGMSPRALRRESRWRVALTLLHGDRSQEKLNIRLRERGFHPLQGRTLPLYDLFLWRTQLEKDFDVELPAGEVERVRVYLMDDFVSRGWS